MSENEPFPLPNGVAYGKPRYEINADFGEKLFAKIPPM